MKLRTMHCLTWASISTDMLFENRLSFSEMFRTSGTRSGHYAMMCSSGDALSLPSLSGLGRLSSSLLDLKCHFAYSLEEVRGVLTDVRLDC